MNRQQLAERFSIPGVLNFEENEHGLIRASITSADCSAEIYLQGAHLTQWHPKSSSKKILFLSEKSVFVPGKAIRGGVPIIFPWFGARTATADDLRTDGPSHGFARTSLWSLDSAALVGSDVQMVFELEANDITRALGYDNFEASYRISIGSDLDLRLTVKNKNVGRLTFEEAFHSYFFVGDVQNVSIEGLGDTEYLDKTDGFKKKLQREKILQLTGETDRPYIDTVAPVDLKDPDLARRIRVEKQNSRTTVIWNPWAELTSKMSDMAPRDWLSMTCIETANVGTDAVTLESGEEHTMQAHVTVITQKP